MLPIKKILLLTDFSEPSYEALKIAKEMAMHFSAELFFIHIIPPLPDDIYVRISQREKIDEALKSLNEKEAAVLRMRFGIGSGNDERRILNVRYCWN